MAIIRRTERTPGRALQQEWDPMHMMQEVLRGLDPFRQMAPVFSDERGFVPQFDVKETKDGYVFKADMPGVKESDIDIALSGNMLTVSGKREAEKQDEGDTWYSYERSYGSFTRSFTLPEAADGDRVRADLRDGVLMVTLPKRPELQPKRIQIGKGGGGTTGSSGEKAKA